MGTTTTSLVFSVSDVYGNRVKLIQRSLDHITEGHPEMAGYLEQIRETVEDPDLKRISIDRGTCVAYEALDIGPQGLNVRVLVEYADMVHENGTTTGKIITAYPASPLNRSRLGPVINLR